MFSTDHASSSAHFSLSISVYFFRLYRSDHPRCSATETKNEKVVDIRLQVSVEDFCLFFDELRNKWPMAYGSK